MLSAPCAVVRKLWVMNYLPGFHHFDRDLYREAWRLPIITAFNRIIKGHIPVIISFVIFIIAVTAETNWAPFDWLKWNQSFTMGFRYRNIPGMKVRLRSGPNTNILSCVRLVLPCSLVDGCLFISATGWPSITSWITFRLRFGFGKHLCSYSRTRPMDLPAISTDQLLLEWSIYSHQYV